MTDKIRVKTGVSGPQMYYRDLPQGRAVEEALKEEKYSFDVPNESLDDTTSESLTLREAVQEVFAAASRLAAKG